MRISATVRRLRLLAVAGAIAATTCVSQAQTTQALAPRGLDWKWMNEAVFDAPKLPSSATPRERELVQTAWADRLAEGAAKSRSDASFVLVASADLDGALYVFSVLLRAGACENPPNGSAGAAVMYARCPMRVLMMSADGRNRVQDFAGYCYLNLQSSDHPRSNFHTEFALDRRTSTAYFRVIQHGKAVPECNRSIRLAAR